MASRTIATIFTVKDKMSKPIKDLSKEMKELHRKSKLSANQMNKFAKAANDAFINATKSTAKFAASSVAVIAGMASKIGLSEAMDLEGYKLQLETATKDTKRASEIMQYAIQLANKTPYEGGELVEAAAKFESMGISAMKYLPLVGDMAAATNKSVDQAAEALIDAQTGELERLKEFGITKALIIDQANQMFRNQMVVNNKGQIVDQDKFNKALEALMKDKFVGGMAKQANSLKGVWSTITGITKSSLAEMFGMTQDGSIRTGSMFDIVKSKFKEVAATFEKYQQDGTFKKMGETITNTVIKTIDTLSASVKFVKDNFNWLAPVLAGTVSAFVAFNVITKVIAAFKILQSVLTITTSAQAALNFVMALNPIGLVAIAIGVLVTAGIALYSNFDKVTESLKKGWTWFTNLIQKIPDFAFILAGPIAPILFLIKHFKEVINIVGSAIDAVKNFFGIETKNKTDNAPTTTVPTSNYEKFAKGGIASKPSIFGDGPEPEMAIPLNKSSRSKKLLAKTASILGESSGVNITIAKLADQIIVREESDIDKIADRIVTKLKQVALNM